MRFKILIWTIALVTLLAMPITSAIMSAGGLYLYPSSAGASSFDCSTINNDPLGSEVYRCDNPAVPCVIDEGQTYWLCSVDGPSYTCNDPNVCFTQSLYLGTPPPMATLFNSSMDNIFLKLKFGVMDSRGSNTIHVIFNRDVGTSPDGFFQITDVFHEKHGCYAIDTSNNGGCSDIVSNDTIKGWHSSQGVTALAKGQTFASLLWGAGPLEIGNVVSPEIVFSTTNANFSVSYFEVNGDLTLNGSLSDSSGSVNTQSLNITGGLTVNGPADLGDVTSLENSVSTININEDSNVQGNLDADDVTSTGAQTTNLVAGSIQTNNNLFARNIVSDGDVRGKLMGKLEISGSCVMQEADGSIAVQIGGC